MKLGILKSYKEIDDLVVSYSNACKEIGVDFVVIDLLSDTWIEDIKNHFSSVKKIFVGVILLSIINFRNFNLFSLFKELK